jgi:hypothetical protein
MMEMECMEAETRGLREELWRAAECEAASLPRKSARSVIIRQIRVAVLAALFVMAAGLPLSVDQDRPFQGFPDSVALLTSTESDIIEALRESLSSRNTGRVLLSVELPDPASDNARRTVGVASAAETVSAKLPVHTVKAVRQAVQQKPDVSYEGEKVDEQPVKTPTSPTIEEVISLIQVGQRALRVSEPAIRIVP